jgi:hypothetical protein
MRLNQDFQCFLYECSRALKLSLLVDEGRSDILEWLELSLLLKNGLAM